VSGYADLLGDPPQGNEDPQQSQGDRPFPGDAPDCTCEPDPEDPDGEMFTHLSACPVAVRRRAEYQRREREGARADPTDAIEKANGPPKDDAGRWQECFDSGCDWRAYDMRWGRHVKGCPNTKAKLLKQLNGKPRQSKAARKLRPEDIGGMLVDVGKAAAQDPRLTDIDRDVYYAMLGRAHGLTETEIMAPRDWLEATTKHPEWKCRTALKRLDRFGYITRITPDDVRRQTLRNWLANHTFEDGRLPGIYRMSLNPPNWGDVPDFTAPLEDGWRDRVDALLST
jgi:hypothetical protein